jgi:hypothetical protein
VNALERRIGQVEDRLDLADLVTRYFLAVDARNYAAVASLFAADARFGDVVGRDAIVALQRADHASMGPTVHSPHFALFELDGDRAAGVVGAHCELVRDGVAVVAAMQYLDRYVRGVDGWRFGERRVEYYYVCPRSEIATSLTASLRKRWPGRPPEAATLPRYLLR